MLIYLKGVYYMSTRQYKEKIYKLGPSLTDVIEFHKIHKKYGRRCDVNRFIPFDSMLRF